LSQLNHTSTGEENEVCLFVNRCKMFRYDATQWKERGLGELKILSNTRTGHRRLVMRRDQIHKLCANHAIVPGMEIKAMKGSTKAFVWQAYGDISDELSKDMMLAARFKDETIANEFVAAITEGFDEDQGAMLGSGETSGKDSGGKVIVISDDENTSNDTSSTTTHQRSSLQHEDDDDDELSITYELTCPKELQLKARKLLLPSSFYNEPTIRLSQRPSKTQALSSSMVDSSTMTSQVASSPTRDLVLTYEKEGSTGDRNKAKQLLLPKSFFNTDGETKERNQTIALDNSDDSDSTDNYGVRNAGTSSSRTANLFTSSIRKYDSSGYGKILFQENADVFKYTTLARDWVESRDSMRVLICRTVASATPNNENCVILFVRDHDNNVCIERTVDRKIRAQFRIDGQPTMVDVQFCGPFKSTEQMALKFESTPQAESFLTTLNECSVDGVNTDDVVSPRDENKSSGNGLPTIFGGSTSAGSTGLSFAKLASNQESGFSSNAGQQFSGAGKSLFGGGNGGDEGGDEGGNDVYVEPIVQLSSVSVTSGEEEEECYFNQRCKLYRFDSANTKKWKERGVGELKLLSHRGNGKARLVMRRDQVRKLCANHFLVEEMDLAPFKTNDLTVTWMAFNDVSEGATPEDALLAVKFKNQSILTEFKERFNLLKRGNVTGLTPIAQKPPEEGSEAKASSVGACDPKLAATMKELKF